MTHTEYANCLVGITKVLKERFNNLTVDEILKLSVKIMDVVIIEGVVNQE